MPQSENSIKTRFKKGEKRCRKQKGMISADTKVKQMLRTYSDNIEDYMLVGGADSGIAKLIYDIETLPPKERVIARLQMLEYVKPKLGRIEVINKPENKVISVFGKLVENTNDEITDIEHTDIE